MSGETMDVSTVMDVIRKDSLFYMNSDGGVTIGGGEPTTSGDFVLDLLQACRDEGFHTCVDTCGFCPAEHFQKVIKLTDLFLFDCKHMDPMQHRHLTGQDNSLILGNLRATLASGIQTRIRIPLMPGLNDSEDNIAITASFLGEFNVKNVDVLPYHAFGRNKYTALLREQPSLQPYETAHLHDVLKRFSRHGFIAAMA